MSSTINSSGPSDAATKAAKPCGARLEYIGGTVYACFLSGDWGKVIHLTSEQIMHCKLRGEIADLLAQ